MSEMSDELRHKLMQMAHKAHEETLSRASGLVGTDKVLLNVTGSNGVVMLTERSLVYSIGAGSVYRTGDFPLAELVVEARVEPGDLLHSLIFGRPDADGQIKAPQRLKAVGDLAQQLVEAVDKARRELPPSRPDSYLVSRPAQNPQTMDNRQEPSGTWGLMLQLRPPQNMSELVGLLERLADLHDQGFLSHEEFNRCKRHLLGE